MNDVSKLNVPMGAMCVCSKPYKKGAILVQFVNELILITGNKHTNTVNWFALDNTWKAKHFAAL